MVNALAKAGIELGENGSIFPRPKGKPLRFGRSTKPPLSDRGIQPGNTKPHCDQRNGKLQTRICCESIVFNCASRQDQRNGKRTGERKSDHSIRKIVKAGRLSLDTLTHQKAPKKKKPPGRV